MAISILFNFGQVIHFLKFAVPFWVFLELGFHDQQSFFQSYKFIQKHQDSDPVLYHLELVMLRIQAFNIVVHNLLVILLWYLILI